MKMNEQQELNRHGVAERRAEVRCLTAIRCVSRIHREIEYQYNAKGKPVPPTVLRIHREIEYQYNAKGKLVPPTVLHRLRKALKTYTRHEATSERHRAEAHRLRVLNDR